MGSTVVVNPNLIAVVKKIIAEQGDSVLSEPKRVSAFLADLAQDVPKPQKNALVKCLELGSAQILKNTEVTERANFKQHLAHRLHDEEGLDFGLCRETLELLATVLFGIESQANSPEISSHKNMITVRRDAFRFKPLTDVTIPNNVTNIGEGAYAVNHLTSVTIPNSVIAIGKKAFFKNQLTAVTIPNNVTSIGEMAFANNELTSVTIPTSLTSIEREIFAYNRLASVTIPKSVTTIENGAFMKNQLTRITIGANVEIEEIAFENEFFAFYNAQSRRAGTYLYGTGRWKLQ
jgi:hypothetical protein